NVILPVLTSPLAMNLPPADGKPLPMGEGKKTYYYPAQVDIVVCGNVSLWQYFTKGNAPNFSPAQRRRYEKNL
ncbi:MAG: hypothetical protein PHC61_04485, partial [Chitinivibrionales bacterium]|nr:hypothetical protein [Chitinivibrionales bacterium]